MAVPIRKAVVLGAVGAALNVSAQEYEHKETADLVALVKDAGELVRARGEAAFADFRQSGSRWRQGETYVFVLDPEGNMLLHPDPELEGKNELELKDINGRPIIRGLIDAATTNPDKPEGWYHYEWPVPGGLLPRWKSSFVRLVTAPSGKSYVVGSGMYNDRMERSFVVDAVADAAALIESEGTAAFDQLRDPKGRFFAKDAYVFVVDPDGVELVNPAHPNLEGRNIRDVRDTHGKFLVRDALRLVESQGSGWLDYFWPKPGESDSTQKSTFVTRARLGDGWVLVGSGVYLEEAPKLAPARRQMTPQELVELVRQGAAVLERRGQDAYPEFRVRGSKWFHEDVYFFVWNMDGTRAFHAADPSLEGQSGAQAKDIQGRPYGRMFLDVLASPSGEGWVHYMFPEPDKIFPAWKSTFLKRVTFPDGRQYLVGCGLYHMQMDRTLVEDLVNRAADLVAAEGTNAFDALRDKTGPFFFMDTYVFVTAPDGTELVNPAQPSIEGKNLIDLKDVNGKAVAREYIDVATKNGSGWVDYYWYRPGENTPSPKLAYVRKVQSEGDTYIVGSGIYLE